MNALDYIKSDLTRYAGADGLGFLSFLRFYFFNRGFRFTFWLRLARFSNYRFFRVLASLQHRRFSMKYMLHIPVETEIGYGLYIGHGGCVIVNSEVKLGNNINLSQFTTIGSNHGVGATIHDDVYIAPNVCIVEDVSIGAGAIIGAGAVVVKDVPPKSTVAGVPAKVIRHNIDLNRYVQNKFSI